MSGLGVDVFAVDNSFAGGGGGSALSANYGQGLFGDGFDGDATIVGTTTLTKEMYYNNLTITGTGTVKPAGFRIFVKGTLTIQAGGSINDDGFAGSGITGGTNLLSRQTLGAQAGSGGNGGTNGLGNGGSSSGGSSSVNPLNQAPQGGAGGAGGANGGGTAGTASGPVQGQRWYGTAWMQQARFSNGTATAQFNGGSGGGGGGSNNINCSGGGGGGGAGIVWIAARNVSNAGRISANGGNGANGFGTAGDAGGGGGGGGGLVCLGTVTNDAAVGTVQCLGGTGGAGFGAGTPGTVGRIGSAMVVVLS